jgi:hypothetical protein
MFAPQSPMINPWISRDHRKIAAPTRELLRGVLETQRAGTLMSSPDELVFRTRTGTPLSWKNLYNRELAPACDRIKQLRISWQSFRHTHATFQAGPRDRYGLIAWSN